MIKRKDQSGFTMLELLITMIILAIGLLGVVGVQTLALKHAQNSNIRSLVNFYAQNMSERIRANVTGFEAGGYNSLTGSASDPGCGTACTTSQLAQLDYYQWRQGLNADIPGATGTVTVGAGVATITINWTERDIGSSSVNQQYVYNARIE